MATSESTGVSSQGNLHQQDLSKLDVTKLTALSPEVISRQATINIGTIGHVAHGKSTVVKAISGVQTVRFKNELERNITIKLERCDHLVEYYRQKANGNVKRKTADKKINRFVTYKKPKEEYEVEKILAQQVRNNQLMFLIKWRNWDDEYNTWEPVAHLMNCTLLLRDFVMKEYERNSGELGELSLKLAPKTTRTKKALEKLMKEIGTYEPPDEDELRQDLLTLLAIAQENWDEAFVGRVSRSIRILELHKERVKQLAALKEWETNINCAAVENAHIVVENNVDLEGPPINFIYVNHYVPGKNVVIPEDPPIGCKCTNCDARAPACCFHQGGGYSYNSKGVIRVALRSPIYECNKRCKCDVQICPNRVVERGRIYPLCIFRTDNGRGWGVKTLLRIPFGKFVCKYVGEVITFEEAEVRGREYDALGRTYLFDLDVNSSDFPYTVDAIKFGNISHFINHSCDPNLGVWAVWGNCLDPNLPTLALFALRNIEKGEEITFDYMARNTEPVQEINSKINSPGKLRPRLDTSNVNRDSLGPRTKCKCGTIKCRQYLF